MKRVTSKNAFAEFAFAEKDGRDALCGWLLDVVNGPKPKPLVISGPAGSGKSMLLMLVAGMFDERPQVEPRTGGDFAALWAIMHLGGFVAVDDCRDGIFVGDVLDSVCKKMRRPYTARDVCVFRPRANVAIALRADNRLEDSMLDGRCVRCRLVPGKRRGSIRSSGEYLKWLVYESASVGGFLFAEKDGKD